MSYMSLRKNKTVLITTVLSRITGIHVHVVMTTSLSGTLFSVPKPKINLTKWDTYCLEPLRLMYL